MANQQAKGLQRLVNAWRFSQLGFKAAYQHEEAFRQEVWALLVLLPLSLWLGGTPVERALLLGSLLLVPIVELLNSAIETNVDRVGLEHHELSGRAKDIASAAVFLVIVFAASVWALILIPRWL
ncbi:MAG: diacylglycerol kinase [Chromatiaceae bacterium]|nr:diacylglycerol kinase [Chromatiaceae bacterium]MCC7278092.1 diacylglycerol kinase [Chromatiaceae bacterium]